MIIQGNLTQSAISRGSTRERQTPPTGEEHFGSVFRVGGRALLLGAQAALRTIPGGEVLSAAVRDGPSSVRSVISNI